MGDFQNWNSEPSAKMLPWVYGIRLHLPPPWLSRRACRRTLLVDRDFSIEEIGGIYRYEFQVRICVDGWWIGNGGPVGVGRYVWSFNIAPRDGSLRLVKPIFCPAGGLLEVNALPAPKFHWRSNPISIHFIGLVRP